MLAGHYHLEEGAPTNDQKENLCLRGGGLLVGMIQWKALKYPIEDRGRHQLAGSQPRMKVTIHGQRIQLNMIWTKALHHIPIPPH